MNAQKLVLSLALAVATCSVSLPGNSAIYKTVDEDGNVVFTDVAPPDSTETVELSNTTSYTPPTSPSNAPLSVAPGSSGPEDSRPIETSYQSLVINSPTQDEAIRDNAGNITVTVAVTPPLAPGHTIELIMDERRVGIAVTGKFSLRNVDRGTHTLSAHVLDADQAIVKQSASQVFHMLRFSALFLQRN